MIAILLNGQGMTEGEIDVASRAPSRPSAEESTSRVLRVTPWLPSLPQHEIESKRVGLRLLMTIHTFSPKWHLFFLRHHRWSVPIAKGFFSTG